MIITKAPLRIVIGGGGTDLPSYYQNYGSMFISAAIDKYVYISLHSVFPKDIIIKYSEMERVKTPQEVKHPIVREALLKCGINSGLEICSFADIPAGTGLGSSGTFTVSLLKALYTYTHQFHTDLSLAEDACDIELNRLHSPAGKQDQYIASVGGLTQFGIDTQGVVTASPLKIPSTAKVDLSEHLLLFFTGYSRSANALLKDQDDKTKAELQGDVSPSSNSVIENLHFVRELSVQIGTCLEKGNLEEFARLMNIHWEHKKKRSEDMSNSDINHWYELGMKNGALGGKLLGAGGGGFLMFLADDKRRLRKAMREAGLQDVPFRFDDMGAQVVFRD
jgi:D-glycero-alpha-D-manno-heptose-7-phosphate kinase